MLSHKAQQIKISQIVYMPKYKRGTWQFFGSSNELMMGKLVK